MKNRELEKRIKDSFENLSPDLLDSVLADCDTQKGRVLIMQKQKKNNRFMKYMAGLAAALILVFGGVSFYHGRHAVASTIMLDVNPSIEISVNKSEKVLAVTPLNEDAQTVVGEMDFSGSSLDVTVNALIGSMLRNGFISDAANSILITVDNDDPAAGQEMQNRLMTEINAILESGNISGAVLGQTVTNDSESQQLAEQYGITSGKAKLIRQITAQNALYSFEDLVPLTIHELNLISESGGTKLENVESIGTASSSGYIGEQAAKEAAFAQVEVEPSHAAEVECELDWEDGMMVYEVEFTADGMEYEFEINAKTGQIVKWGAGDTVQTAVEAAARARAYAEAAVQKSIAAETQAAAATAAAEARARADIAEAQAEALAHAEDAEEAAVAAARARAEEAKADAQRAVAAEAQAYAEAAVAAAQADAILRVYEDYCAANQALTDKNKAKAAALDHAGVKESDIRDYQCELDREHGKAVYEIEFKAGGYEYDYEIDASDGTILKSEKERD